MIKPIICGCMDAEGNGRRSIVGLGANVACSNPLGIIQKWNEFPEIYLNAFLYISICYLEYSALVDFSSSRTSSLVCFYVSL